MIDLSVVITCFNRKDYLEYALASFATQTLQKDRFEVIVVDDGSTDGTIDRIRSQSWPFRLITVPLKDNMGISYARNRGIDKAKGKIVVFSDSDIIVPPDYLKYHWKAHRKADRLVVSAPYRFHIYSVIHPEQLDSKLWREMQRRAPKLSNRIPDNLPNDGRLIPVLTLDEIRSGYAHQITPGRSEGLKSEFIIKYPNINKSSMPWLVYAGSNSSVPRKSLLEINGFDENIRKRHDDRDLGYRLQLSGHRFVLEPRVIATHQDHLLKKEQTKLEYFSFHDLAIMLKKNPHLDLYLFGLYQTDRKGIRCILLPELKRQMKVIKKLNKRGKRDIELITNLLRRFVIQTIHSVVNKAMLSHLEEPLKYNASYYKEWEQTLNRYSRYPLFIKTAKYLINHL